MAALILPSRWTQQPQYPSDTEVIPGLVSLVDFVQYGAPYDLISKSFLTRVGTDTAVDVTRKGVGLKNTTETSYWTLPIKTETHTSLSILWIGSVAGGTAQMVLRDATSVSGTIPLWRADGWGMRSGGATFAGVGTFSLNRLYTAVATFSDSNARLYVDGVLTAANGATGGVALTSPWHIHHNGINNEGPLATSLLLAIWARTLADGEAQHYSANPWELFAPQVRRIYFNLESGSAATIIPSGISSTEAFGTTTLARMSVHTATVTGVTSAETFGTAVVARTNSQSVSTPGIASAESFGLSAVTRSSVQAATPGGIASSEAFGTATVTRISVQAVSVAGIGSTEAFGSLTITQGGIVPQGISSAETFGTATFARTSVKSVSATGIASGEVVGSAAVTRISTQSIVASGIVSGEVFGSAAFTRSDVANVLPSGITSGEEFGTASVSFTVGTVNVNMTGLVSGEAFGRPAVVSDAPITALVFGAAFEMLQMNRRREEARKKRRLS